MIRKMLTFIRLLTFAVLLGAVAPAMARAQITDMSQVISVEVLPGWRRADGTHVAGLRFSLKRGWKTYWRSAGAAGISPQMDWRGSRNVRSVTPAWPTPSVFRQGDALSIGYDRDFILPLLIAAGNGPAELRGRVDIGVCADICLPAQVDVAAVLNIGGQEDPGIRAALADRPRRVEARARCLLRPIANGFAITGQIEVPSQGRAEAVVFEMPDPDVWVTDARVTRRGGRIDASAQMLKSGNRSFGIDRSQMRITVIGSRGAVEVMGCTG
ncbi:Thiol-disulfide interchange protein, contains DsbC and DsbD domains [Jannaschia faecimaris]|uniref:Thiol-disulfide interchange protein, contains DsbC and DsbD domains n=1 Tax=Jannaschia faecimaris TaxID=1244108 RepID=A0A1H3QTB3_9RHOB|nr:protein-disulfide reductase DsbD domain-containing protein [Jannaschia faecimaris]SDZ16832.1 Thiol-disulfide interchange protein, contains DsbC and DsbD domains [Jannaschia faecimaris]